MKPPLFDYQRANDDRRGRGASRDGPGCDGPRRRPEPHPGDELPARQPVAPRRHPAHSAAFAGIRVEDGAIVVKAMTRHRELELNEAAYARQSADPRGHGACRAYPDPQPRHRGGQPLPCRCGGRDADGAGADRRQRGRRRPGRPARRFAADDFFQFHMTTSRRRGRDRRRGALSRLCPRAPATPSTSSRAAMATTPSPASARSSPRPATAPRERLALAACGIGSRPVRLRRPRSCSRASRSKPATSRPAGAAAAEAVTAADDMHATTAYRRSVLATLVRRAVERPLRARQRGEQTMTRGAAASSCPRLGRPEGRASRSPSTASRSSATSACACCSPISCATSCGLTGTHVGCEHGVCGACTVLIDGKLGALLPDASRCRPQGAEHPHHRSRSPPRTARFIRSSRRSRNATRCSAATARRA